MHFGFLVFDGVEELDLFGPWEMAALWHRHLQGPYRPITVAARSGAVVCNMGTRLLPDHGFDDCPALDVLLVPGGEGTAQAAADERVLAFVRAQAACCRAVLSVCTGSFVLQAAGLLAGREATTHWARLPALGELPGVAVRPERVVHSGPVWTAAGVSAGIDMLLAFIAHEAGEEVAGQVQLVAEYYPSPRLYGPAHRRVGAPAYLAPQPGG